MDVGVGTPVSFPGSQASKLDKGPGQRLKCSGWHGKAPSQSLAGKGPGWILPSCAACHAQSFLSTAHLDPQAPSAAVPEGSPGGGHTDPWER